MGSTEVSIRYVFPIYVPLSSGQDNIASTSIFSKYECPLMVSTVPYHQSPTQPTAPLKQPRTGSPAASTQEPQITALVITPGWVQTEMGYAGAQFVGLEQAELTVEESCDGMVAVIEKANKEEYGGTFWNYGGMEDVL